MSAPRGDKEICCLYVYELKGGAIWAISPGDITLEYWYVCEGDQFSLVFLRTEEEVWYENDQMTSLWSNA